MVGKSTVRLFDARSLFPQNDLAPLFPNCQASGVYLAIGGGGLGVAWRTLSTFECDTSTKRERVDSGDFPTHSLALRACKKTLGGTGSLPNFSKVNFVRQARLGVRGRGEPRQKVEVAEESPSGGSRTTSQRDTGGEVARVRLPFRSSLNLSIASQQ